MFAVVTASLLTFSLGTGQIQETPDRIISGHGLELVNDGRVFLLFASLNGLGYSKETLRKGPPLEAPVYHPLRIVTRDALRKLAAKGELKPLKDLFESQGQSIDKYLSLILSYDRKLSTAAEPAGEGTKQIGAAVDALRSLSKSKDVSALVDAVGLKQRDHAKSLMAVLEKDFAAAEKQLGLERLAAPATLSIIPNPLDSHNTVRKISVGSNTVFVVGPGHSSVRSEILRASLKPLVSKWVTEHWSHARKLKKHWRGLKVSKRITSRFPDGQSFLTETLTRTLAYHVGIYINDVKLEPEDYIDHESKEGFRWTRACLKALSQRDKSKPIDADFAALIKAIAP